MSEKFEKIKSMKDRLICIVDEQISGDVSNVDAKELGEVVDIIKDLSEVVYYCSITDAMEKSSDNEVDYYMNKYYPETRYYTPYMDAERKRDMDKAYSRMYYTEPKNMWSDNMMMQHDSREGKSPMSRRMYMEIKDTANKENKMNELDKYIHDLGDDIVEMVSNLDANEKAAVKTKIANLASKII